MVEVGELFYNNKGEEYVVNEYIYINSKRIRVTSTDGNNYSTWVCHSQIRSGRIKNPYRPVLFNIGYFGEGEYRAKYGSSKDGAKHTKEYATWVNMLSRCYDSNYIKPHIYSDVYVCDEWHNFQTFAEWYNEELKHCLLDGAVNLDKDLIGDGTLYHPDLCCLIPSAINSFCVKNTVGNSKTNTTGVLYYNSAEGKPIYYPTTNTSVKYSSLEDAKEAYIESKIERFNFLIKEYKDKVHPKVIKALQEKDFAYLLDI